MASRKRALDPQDKDERVVHKHPRLDPSLLPPLHGSSSLLYPSTSQTVSRRVPFQRPLPLISFSYTEDRKLEFNDAAMRYYVNPPPDADLCHGYERWIRRPEERGRLDGLLRAISEIRRRETGDPVISLVSWRGVMTKILTAPYEDRDGWELNVMAINGTLYFEEFISDTRLKEKEDLTPHHRMQTYYGYAFESWCTAPRPDSPSGWGGDVDTNVQWCSVVKTKLGDVRMVIGGEVDCVRDRYNGNNDTMMELKTSMTIRGDRDKARFEKKLLKFYFQSFLLGVPEIVVGFRTPNGKLMTVESYKTLEIPRMVRDKQNAWDPQICLSWGEKILIWLKSSVGESGSDNATPENVWRVKFTPRVGVELALLSEEERREVEAGEDRIGFLPKWYYTEIQDASSQSAQRSRGASGAESEQSRSSAPSESIKRSLPVGWQI